MKPLALQADEVETSLLSYNYLPRVTRAITELPPSFTAAWLTPAPSRGRSNDRLHGVRP